MNKKTIRKWTKEEEDRLTEILLNNTNRLNAVEIGRMIGRGDSSVRLKAKTLGYNLGRSKRLDETAICRMYKEMGSIKAVEKTFRLGYEAVVKVLKKHDVKIQHRSRFRDLQDGIVKDYLKGELSAQEIAKKYGFSETRIGDGLKALGLHDPSRRPKFMIRKPSYDTWVDKYGREEADLRLERRRLKMSSRSKGSQNPMYGKPSARGTGNGWKGWYRNHYFRSLREVMFMIEMDTKGVKWASAEIKAFTIRYEFMGVARTYRPDFIVGNELWELKPKKLHSSPNVTAKRIAAEVFCAERGLVYRLEDIEIKKDVIHEVLKSGLIKFDRDYEKRFLEYVA